MIEPKVFTVGQINRYIKNLLENDFILNSLLVQGEISNFKAHSSGHWYFTLKDAQGAISCVIFRQDAMQIPFLPENGMKVILYGHVSLYEKTGQYQLYGEFLEPIGMGALQIAFEQMKEKLAAEGLFDADFKREIPAHVGCIAVITSSTGAAVRDIIQIAKRRDPRVKIAVFPTLVQGEAAAEDIVKSLKLANEWGKADVIILGRGGGSMEDLWAFNEEIVARAIFASELPVISAVGHETDFTIADFVSDLRAPTPSAAAELATEPLESIKEDLKELTDRLDRNVQAVLISSKRRLDFLKERPVLKRPLEGIRRTQMYLEEKERLLLRETLRKLEKDKQKLAVAEAGLQAVSPFSIMQRGYAMLMDTKGKPVTTAEAAAVGQALQVRMKDGILQAEVTGKAVFAHGEKETIL
ncbi:MAG: exodeoxyribonuclease VII large subunit [Bacteroidales bacterium]|nr:exodeoxyribonuclease VII large subunit [Anaerotignum sp.]MCI5678816.1 exodeoxyribonuclease VII large subunit [Bacteroidales bacterium]MDY3926820.1 exodeoxyribonuclease VII large subunit [Anaerotignum sp.]